LQQQLLELIAIVRQSAAPAAPTYARVLTKRMVGPQPACTDSVHHWQSGLPPLPYVWVLRWQAAQGATLSPGQIRADGSGSVIGGGVGMVVPVPGGAYEPPKCHSNEALGTAVRAAPG
jgi:hypothetical protein